ncbi:glycosyltransferase [Halobacillus massiliensis]|uniref:glycosyltransferase n=1 Tax=Halobacillus massiliensis TaxID=1926286 RepID=UPI0009E467C1|nr:glycosyltransferase family 2 protein [Halobacillus massiliensis]
MWLMVIAGIMTVFLFWHKVSFPDVKARSNVSYSIIIPARNEEKNLERLLSTLMKDYDDKREVIVVDDQSDDRTYEIAVKFGATAIQAPPLPKEWMGKSWACYNGAKEASGEVLLFLDADTWFSKDGPEKLVQYIVTTGTKALVTVHPYHYMCSFWEKLSAVFHLVVFSSSGITPILKKYLGVQGGFGPCLLIYQNTYWELEGHHSIRKEIVEHLSMARRAQSKGIKTFAYSGKGIVNMRMYPASLRKVINGWSKSFASGAKSASPVMTAANILWISALASFLTNLEKAGWWSLAGYFFISIWLYRTLKEIGSFKWYDALLIPVYFLFFVLLFIYSLLKTFFSKEMDWKGRNISNKK